MACGNKSLFYDTPPEIYLDIFKHDNSDVECPVYTAIILFSINYCEGANDVKITFVKRCLAGNEQSVKLNRNLLLERTSSVKEEDVNEKVRRCQYPVALTRNGTFIHSGLCSVLRVIVAYLHKCHPERNLGQLLGFRQSCLRACAEVSTWTKFCEIDFPQMTAIPYDSLLIPRQISQLENHLGQPPIIPNVGKRKKEVLVQKMKSLDMQVSKRNVKQLTEVMKNMQVSGEIQGFSQENWDVLLSVGKIGAVNDLSTLQHLYAEGTDYTLTDLILYPCIVIYFNGNEFSFSKQCPLTSAWLERLEQLPYICTAALKSGLPPFKIRTAESDDRREVHTYDGLDVETPENMHRIKSKLKFKESDIADMKIKMQELGMDVKSETHPCIESICLPWQDMPIAVHPIEGDLKLRANRKCQQLESMALAVKHIAKDGDVIVDFCAGSGHLGLLIAYLLPKAHILLVENKEESLARVVDRIEKLGMTNITLYQSNVDYFVGTFDIGVCLHACGVATDLVMQKCLAHGAKFVVCPCCYGSIQNTHMTSYPSSNSFREAEFTYDMFQKVAHMADHAQEGKMFMNIVDHDRSEWARELGYTVTLTSLHPLSCSPKNNLIIGTK